MTLLRDEFEAKLLRKKVLWFQNSKEQQSKSSWKDSKTRFLKEHLKKASLTPLSINDTKNMETSTLTFSAQILNLLTTKP